MNKLLDKLGVVVIGRNEGERLKCCLRSVLDEVKTVVYVDSGSTDGSIEFAKTEGIDVVELDMSIPFTMARGRNAGFERILEIMPDVEFIQFVDGDCELFKGYLKVAVHTMHNDPGISVVTGFRIERSPDASPYNRLCNIEWGREIGEIQSSGGDMMVRPEQFLSVGMFNPIMIAGEEPELCVRLRKRGGKIVRIDQNMTLHDAAMHRFSQWWKRAVRGGHAYAEGCAIHCGPPEHHKLRQVLSTIFWGSVIPTAILFTVILAFWCPFSMICTFFLMFLYPILIVKIYYDSRNNGLKASDARLYAIFCVLGKIPSMVGFVKYWTNRFLQKQSTLIEYKAKPSSLSQNSD